MILGGVDLLVGLLMTPGLSALMGALIPGIFATDAWITSQLYLGFLGIWAILLLLVLIPRNRPILKALGIKTKKNTPQKTFAVILSFRRA